MNNILFYFVLYSFFGWCMESICKTITARKPVNSGFLHGPFCPIYGFGAIIMIVLLQKLSNNIVLLFIVSTLILTIWEYLVGLILEKIFKTKYWDYSHLKFNLHGRVCLKNSIYWGLLGVVFIKIIHPFFSDRVVLIPREVLMCTNILIYIALLTDMVITITKLLFIDKKVQKLNELSEKIKEKLQELKQSEKLEIVAKENIQKVISDLKREQTIIKIKLYKQIIRLKKAFPTMQSETINKLMSKKIDIQALKEKIKKKGK